MAEPEEKDRKPGTVLERYRHLERTVLEEFPELIEETNIERSPGDNPRNLRIFFKDSFMDIWVSEENYSFHWQSDGQKVRFDNAPHHQQLETFPDHMHVNEEVKETILEGEIEEKLVSAIEYLEEGFISN
jgi:hypothetical protein